MGHLRKTPPWPPLVLCMTKSCLCCVSFIFDPSVWCVLLSHIVCICSMLFMYISSDKCWLRALKRSRLQCALCCGVNQQHIIGGLLFHICLRALPHPTLLDPRVLYTYSQMCMNIYGQRNKIETYWHSCLQWKGISVSASHDAQVVWGAGTVSVSSLLCRSRSEKDDGCPLCLDVYQTSILVYVNI